MKLLVGIPSFRRPERLAGLLRSLERQDGLGAIIFEVFVADNDPECAEAFALCEDLRATYPWPLSAAIVLETGISAARNRILVEGQRRGVDFLAMVDDDEIASPGWLSQLIAAQSRFDVQVVGGPVLYAFDGSMSDGLAGSGAFPLKRRVSGVIPLLEAGGNVLLDCAALAALGWPTFDPAFGLTGGEDKEYFTRLKRAGLTFAWADGAIVQEHVPAVRMRARSIVRRAYGIGSSDYRIDALYAPA